MQAVRRVTIQQLLSLLLNGQLVKKNLINLKKGQCGSYALGLKDDEAILYYLGPIILS